MNNLSNRGLYAGGAQTNINGKRFECKTALIEKLTSKHNWDIYNISIPNGKFNYISKKFEHKTIYHVKQYDFKKFMKNRYNVTIEKNPDEAYIIEHDCGDFDVKIVEMKNQNCDGSVEEKLLLGSFWKEYYEYRLNTNNKGIKFNVDFSFCVSSFLKEKLNRNTDHYTTIQYILKKHNIKLFYGDDSDYFEKIYDWVTMDVPV